MKVVVTFLVCAVCYVTANISGLKEKRAIDIADLPDHVTTPPKIKSKPAMEIAYQEKKPVTIPCEAEGTPPIIYEWKYNEQFLDIDGVKYRQTAGTGTLQIEAPGAEGETDIDGSYQCFARNGHGRAVSIKTTLRRAYIKSFEQKEPKQLTRNVGDYLRLDCEPPESYPTALVYWGSGAGNEYTNVELSKRVALDYEGRLHFINILEDDGMGGSPYICTAQNFALRSLSQGDDTVVRVQPITGTPSEKPPKLEWSSQQNVVAIEGESVKMMCIFSGYPTPNVKWERLGGAAPASGTNLESQGGLEMRIQRVKGEHAGRYRCVATSPAGSRTQKTESKVFTLRVEYRPRWKDGIEPQDVTASDGENAEIQCAAEGVPYPSVRFSFNGNAVSDSDTGNDRRRIEGDKVYFTSLTKEDTQVIQCNASNSHGYIFTNVFINVLAEAPAFIEEPLPIVKRAEGQEVILTCRVFGAPTPVITWKRGNPAVEVPTRNNPQYEILPEGDLKIRAAVKTDAGTYHCHAQNKFGQESRSGQLLIRESTKIDYHPRTQIIEANNDVMFFCNATTDPEEIGRLTIEWLKNGETIDYFREGKIDKNMRDNRLIITQAQPSDTGTYTCVAGNDIDEDRSSAQLTVKDRPDPPRNIHLDACLSSAAQISWQPGNENNDEVIEFIVKYNTTFDPPHTYHIGASVSKGVNNAQMTLSPYANYTFHVVARNTLGISAKSDFTQAPCTTVAKRPQYDPDWVCTSSENPSHLVIRWMKFPPIIQNGSDFKYIVNYRLANGDPLSPIVQRNVTDWTQNELIVPGQQPYTKYEIWVKTYNEKGLSRARDQRVEGYSGEGVPEVTPENFDLDHNSVNDTHAKFYWDSVDADPSLIRGVFKGYRIVYWRQENPDEKRRTDFIENPTPQCPPEGAMSPSLARFKRAVSKQGIVGNLWPYSNIMAAVQVMNGGKVGALSAPPLSFRTLQGAPGPVMLFRISERGSHHLKVEWLPPVSANGILTKYEIGYEEVGGRDGLQIDGLVEIGRHHKKIHNLKERTRYQVYIWAYTEAGQGRPMMDEGVTKAAAPPDAPVVGDVQFGDTWANVSWTPSEEEEPNNNPGTYFYVEFKRPGSDVWEKTPIEKEHNWINITGLEPGYTDVRVVAVNGRGDETRSPTKTIYVGPNSDATAASIASKGWFIGLMCALIFLLLILLIICLIRRNRGGKYPVHEKEKLAGRDPDKEDEEAGFNEYTKNDQPKKKKVPTATLC